VGYFCGGCFVFRLYLAWEALIMDLGSLFEAANSAIEFFNNLPANSDSYWERIVKWIIIAWLESKLFFMEMAYGVASGIIQSFGISETINSAWSSLPPLYLQVFTYLMIPDAINMILTAAITRFVMELLPV